MSLQASQGFQICFEVGEEGGADPRFLNPYGEQVIAHTCGIIAWQVRKCPPHHHHHHHRRLAELRPALRRAPGGRPAPPLLPRVPAAWLDPSKFCILASPFSEITAERCSCLSGA